MKKQTEILEEARRTSIEAHWRGWELGEKFDTQAVEDMAFENAAWENAQVFHQDGDYREYAVSLGRTFGPPNTCVIVNGEGFDTRAFGNNRNRLSGDGGG